MRKKTPNSKEASNFNTEKPVGDGLEFGDWNFLGVWGLELGILKI
jgi:hypothetical protein